MRDFFKSLFYNKSVHIRFIFLMILFLIIFNGTTILSHFLLSEGFLRGKNSVLDWDTSSHLLLSTVQIFSYNSISIIIIVIANFFPFPKKKGFMPLGYWCLMILFVLNGITLGTWSFTAINTAAPNLFNKLMRTFNISRGAGLWEMTGQMLITSATAQIAVIGADSGDTYIRSFRDASLSKTEIIYIFIGICLMFTGAFIESIAIAKTPYINLK